MALREYAGTAKTTSLAGAISAAAVSINVADGTGYPTGAVGPFVVTIDAGLAAEEKVLCTSRTGNTLTVSSRGWDGTTASDHDNAATVQHTLSATDLREANAHVNDAVGDPHPQYLTSAEADALFLTPAEGNAAYGHEFAAANVDATETTSSTSYIDIATLGPAVTVTVPSNGRVLVILSAGLLNATVDQFAYMGFTISGAHTTAAQDSRSLFYQSPTAGREASMSRIVGLTGITPGSCTFTAKYRASGGTAHFRFRGLTVITFGA